MKLKTVSSLWGQKMTIWDNIEIEFGKNGIVEVKDSVGKLMLEKYPSLVFEEDYEKEKPKTVERELPERFKAGTECMRVISKADTKTEPTKKETEEKPIKKGFEQWL